MSDLSTFLERETGRIDLGSVNPSWLIFSDGFASGRMLSSAAKRAFDIAASLLLLVLTLPAVAIVALAIKLDSRGPALFKQKRYGFNNELIEVYKFRSMYDDQCDATASKLVAKGDPRVTRVGRFIRKTSIDEFPQFFNALIGNLSLVGPRPHAAAAKAQNRL